MCLQLQNLYDSFPLYVKASSFMYFFLCLQEKSTYINGKATHKITVIPKVNLTVTCIVSNKLGEDFMTINVSSGKLMPVKNLVGWLAGIKRDALMLLCGKALMFELLTNFYFSSFTISWVLLTTFFIERCKTCLIVLQSQSHCPTYALKSL